MGKFGCPQFAAWLLEHILANSGWASFPILSSLSAAFSVAVIMLSVSLLDDWRSELDTLLAAAGVARRFALTTPHFMATLAAISATDLVTTISRPSARRFAADFDLLLHETPFVQTSLTTTLDWSSVWANDPLLAWIMSLLRDPSRFAGERRDTVSER